jgi:ribosome-binding factor A
MTRRLAQVESTLQRAIAEVIQRHLADPRIRGLVSITRVKVSPDLADAQVFVSIMPASHERRTMTGLHRATGRIQALTRQEVALKSMPRLRFELDQSLKRQADVYDAIREGISRSGPGEGDDPEAEAPPLDPEDASAGDRLEVDPPVPDEPHPGPDRR